MSDGAFGFSCKEMSVKLIKIYFLGSNVKYFFHVTTKMFNYIEYQNYYFLPKLG